MNHDELQDARHAVLRAVRDYNAQPEFEVGEVLRDAAIELVNASAVYLDPDELLGQARRAADEWLIADPARAREVGRELRELFLDFDELLTRGAAGPVEWTRGLRMQIEPVPVDEDPAAENERLETRFGGDAR